MFKSSSYQLVSTTRLFLKPPNDAPLEYASKREKLMMETARKGRGKIETEEGETWVEMGFSGEGEQYKVVVNN